MLHSNNNVKIAYESRLWKYRKKHNFDVFWDSLDRSRVRKEFAIAEFADLKGLARLLYFESLVKKPRDVVLRWLPQKISTKRPALFDTSGYTSRNLPFGKRYTAAE
jgi:hypothetical protein